MTSSEISILKSKLLIFEQKYQNECRKNQKLTQEIAKLQPENSKSPSKVGSMKFLKIPEFQENSKITTELIQTNVNLLESKRIALSNLKEIIKAQEIEIERLKIYKNDFFDLKSQNLEQKLVFQELQKSILISENNFKKEISLANEKQKKWKRKMTKNYELSQKSLEKLTEKIFEMEKRMKNISAKQNSFSQKADNFSKVKKRFKVVIHRCFLRIRSVEESASESLRKAILWLMKLTDLLKQTSVEIKDESAFLNQKLREYHLIIVQIGLRGNFDFNNESLQNIYETLERRNLICTKFVDWIGKTDHKVLGDRDLEHFVTRIFGVELKEQDDNSCYFFQISK